MRQVDGEYVSDERHGNFTKWVLVDAAPLPD